MDAPFSEALLEELFDRLWPLCRSLSGNGVRETFRILKEYLPVQVYETPSGTQVFDWTVPDEWNIADAWLEDEHGKRFAEFSSNNLHVVSYSIPVDGWFTPGELKNHLFTLPEFPDAIPYRSTYYKKDWGFCVKQADYNYLMGCSKVRAVIKSSLAPGSMTFADYLLPGKSKREVLFTTYTCHPSMANNELSGILVTAFLARTIARWQNRYYTYRFVFVPETIGSINYLHLHGEYFRKELEAGYVVTCVGDDAPFNFKVSREGSYELNELTRHVLHALNEPFKEHAFRPLGSDERQYCSPGFNLPVAVLSRSIFHQYPEYHTSLDNKDFISFKAMCRTIEVFAALAKALELNDSFLNLQPFGEPQLGKRGLYPDFGGMRNHEAELVRRLYLLNYADGKHNLREIAVTTGESIFDYEATALELIRGGLLKSSRP